MKPIATLGGWEVRSFIICEDIRDTPGTLPIILGLFDEEIAVKDDAPVTLRHLAFRIYGRIVGAFPRKLRFRLVGPDGTHAMDAVVDKYEAGSDFSHIALVFQADRIRFTKFGEYKVVLAVDDSEGAEVGTFILKKSAPRKPQDDVVVIERSGQLP